MKTSEAFGRKMLRSSALMRPMEPFKVGLLIPTSGAMGLLGPSAYACARLACEAWNDHGGVRGREVTLTVLDSSERSMTLDHELDTLIRAGEVDALVNLSTTAVCRRISDVVDSRVPLVYTPHFEGVGLPSWVHAIGETPDRQLLPAIDWMIEHKHVRRWYLLGNDYCWPRRTAERAVPHIRGRGAEVVAQRFVPIGERDFEPIIEDIERTRADAVLVSLIGTDGVHMCRSFGQSRLNERVLRLSLCIEENALIGMGEANTDGLYISAGYFASVDSDANGSFKERYHQRFGERAPQLNALSQSVYEGFVHLQRQAQDSRLADALTPLNSVRGARRRATASNSAFDPIFLAETQGMGVKVVGSIGH